MGSIGKLITTKIENYVIGIVQKRLGQNIEGAFYSASGDDSPPLSSDKTFIAQIDGKGKYIFLGTLMKSEGAGKGEKKLFSRDSAGSLKAYIYLKNDGILELNGNADYAVSWDDLNTALQSFKNDINAEFATKQDGAGTAGTVSIDISGAKVEEVKLP